MHILAELIRTRQVKNFIHIAMANGIQNQTETVKDPIMSEGDNYRVLV